MQPKRGAGVPLSAALVETEAAHAGPSSNSRFEAETYRKVARRLLPLLFVCFVFNYIDRINIGYAQLQMKPDLGFSDAIYGLGASMFYVGYLFFEIPSNLLMQKIGARKTLLRIMFCWGITSAATMFVKSPYEFYTVRFLLGVFEGGFFPGIVLYLTFWFPPARRARVVAIFMSAGVTAGIIAGPLSGWMIHHLDQVHGLRGWQWMYVLQGLPSSLLGVVAYLYLPDRPQDAGWLSPAQRDLIAAQQGGMSTSSNDSTRHGLMAALRHPSLFTLAYLYFALNCGVYTLSFWSPALIQGLGVTNIQHIGLYSLIPYSLGAVAMLYVGRRSDARAAHRGYFTVSNGLGALGLAATTLTPHMLWPSMAFLSLSTIGLVSALPVFWALATAALPKEAAPAAIAAITTVSGIAGAVCPAAVGFVKTLSGSLDAGLYGIALLLASGAVVMLLRGTTVMLPTRRSLAD
jgi:MFS family permease